jgi:hypothetical protein
MNGWEALVIIAGIAAFCFYCWLVSKSEPEENAYDKIMRYWEKRGKPDAWHHEGPTVDADGANLEFPQKESEDDNE